MSRKLNFALLLKVCCIFCISISSSAMLFAQKTDSANNISRARRINKAPQIKVNIPTYKPKNNYGFIPYTDVISASGAKTIGSTGVKAEKLLTVLKVYPNPVNDQVNLLMRIDRESGLSIKIMDLLGNEVITLANERIGSGEQTRSYEIPDRLNAGIYFLKIVAGSETIVRRISVL